MNWEIPGRSSAKTNAIDGEVSSPQDPKNP